MAIDVHVSCYCERCATPSPPIREVMHARSDIRENTYVAVHMISYIREVVYAAMIRGKTYEKLRTYDDYIRKALGARSSPHYTIYTRRLLCVPQCIAIFVKLALRESHHTKRFVREGGRVQPRIDNVRGPHVARRYKDITGCKKMIAMARRRKDMG